MPSKALFQAHQLHTAKRLFIASAICLFAIYGLYTISAKTAKKSEQAYLIKSLSQLLPDDRFDTSLLQQKYTDKQRTIYQTCQHDQPDYAIFEIQTNQGYSGKITLLVSVALKTKTVMHLRPLFHQETPGLGDQIDTDKSDWLMQFRLPLATDSKMITLKKDGGSIDAITGATITSRAISELLQQQIFATDVSQLPNLCSTQKS